MSMANIRERYGVPAKRGMRVTVDGKPGVITSASRECSHLMVRFDEGPRWSLACHPTWEFEYHEAVTP